MLRPPINWVDRGRVYKVGQKSCVPVDCYHEVLVIEEFERNKPGAYQLKYYAPGVGDIRVGWRGPEEEEKEELGVGQRCEPKPTRSEPKPARARWNWRSTLTRSRSTLVRHSQRSPRFESGKFVGRFLPRLGALLRERC